MAVPKSIIGRHNVDIPDVKPQVCSCMIIRELPRKQLPANPSVTTMV